MEQGTFGRGVEFSSARAACRLTQGTGAPSGRIVFYWPGAECLPPLLNGELYGVRNETIHVEKQRIPRARWGRQSWEIGDLQIHLVEAVVLALRPRVCGRKDLSWPRCSAQIDHDGRDEVAYTCGKQLQEHAAAGRARDWHQIASNRGNALTRSHGQRGRSLAVGPVGDGVSSGIMTALKCATRIGEDGGNDVPDECGTGDRGTVALDLQGGRSRSSTGRYLQIDLGRRNVEERGRTDHAGAVPNINRHARQLEGRRRSDAGLGGAERQAGVNCRNRAGRDCGDVGGGGRGDERWTGAPVQKHRYNARITA